MSLRDLAMPADILLVSNGYGESAVASYIARAIVVLEPAVRVEHFPLIGTIGLQAWPPAVGPAQAMPSGGLVANWNVRNLSADLRAGLFRLTLRQFRFLATQRARSVIIAVGDIYCLALCLAAAKRPTIFVATAKSDRVSPHSPLEGYIARKAAVTFVRDEATAVSLCARGVRARYAGNVMMDGVDPQHADLGMDNDALRLALLPGSRADAPRAVAASLERLSALAEIFDRRGRRVQAFISIAPSVDAASIVRVVRASGIDMPDNAEGSLVIARGKRRSLEVALVRGALGDLLAASQVVLGQAGTANEQAAGAGRPVIAALEQNERADRMSWYRMRQKRLLGDALLVLPGRPDEFARFAAQLVDDPNRLAHMARVGRERMGGPGGASAVAGAALALATGGSP